MTNKIAVKRYFSFQGLCISIIEKTGTLPPDVVMNTIATYFGWSRSIASQTRKDLEEKGYKFTRRGDGWYEVEWELPPSQIVKPLAPVGIATSDDDELTIEEMDAQIQDYLSHRLTQEQRAAADLLFAMLMRMGDQANRAASSGA